MQLYQSLVALFIVLISVGLTIDSLLRDPETATRRKASLNYLNILNLLNVLIIIRK